MAMISTASMPPNASPTESSKEKTDSVVLMNGQPHSTPGKFDKWNLMEVSVGFDVTRKGERSLVINGYKFTKSRDGMSDRVFWRCSRRECKATAVTVGERLEHVRILHDHERPPSGEFYASSAAAAATTTTATAVTSHSSSPSNCRVRRRSNQQSRGGAKQNTKSAGETSTEKNSSSPSQSRSAILPNITQQKQLISDPETTNENKSKSENGFHVMAPDQHQQCHPPQLFPAVSLAQEVLMAPKYSAVIEMDSRGLTALADAAASQSKRDSQNSTPDPPFEAPVTSPTSSLVNNVLPSGATVMGGPFLLLGPRDLNHTTPTSASLVGGNNSSEVPLLPTPSYFPICTRRFSVSEVPVSARSCLPRSSIQTDQYSSLRTSNFMGNFCVCAIYRHRHDTDLDTVIAGPLLRHRVRVAVPKQGHFYKNYHLPASQLTVMVLRSVVKLRCSRQAGHPATHEIAASEAVSPNEKKLIFAPADKVAGVITKALYEAGIREGILPSTLASTVSTTSGGGILLHWKKEKMLESKAEEEAEKEHQQHQQYGRRRYYTASVEGSSSATAAAAKTPGAVEAVPTSQMTPGIDAIADDQLPLKRKRCASECHPPISVASSFSPSDVASGPNNPLSTDPTTTAVVTPPPQDQPYYTDWCVQVHNELQIQMYTTIRQLLARVSAADGAENVISLCSAMTACLDTITANKRARQDVLPTTTTSTP